MKIAIASTGLGHIYRGVEAWADDTAATLYKKGIDVTLFKGGGEPEHPYEVVVPCYQRDLPKTHRLIKFFSQLVRLAVLYGVTVSCRTIYLCS